MLICIKVLESKFSACGITQAPSLKVLYDVIVNTGRIDNGNGKPPPPLISERR